MSGELYTYCLSVCEVDKQCARQWPGSRDIPGRGLGIERYENLKFLFLSDHGKKCQFFIEKGDQANA